MNRRLLLCFALAQGLLFAVPAQADRTDDYLKTEMDQRRIPGAALMIIQDGQPVKTAAYGRANLRVERAGQTGNGLRNRLDYQTVHRGLHSPAGPGRQALVGRPISRHLGAVPRDWGNITVRHLLTHTSGLKNYTGLKGFALTRHLTQEQFIETIGRQPLEFKPGKSWKYSESALATTCWGSSSRSLDGKSYWDFVSERVWQPLGMNATTNRLPSLVIPNRAAGYEQTNHVHINRDSDLT